MTSAIAQLWNGNVDPLQRFGRNNAEIRETERLMENSHEEMENLFNQTEKESFKKYSALVDEYLMLNSEQAFCDGFSLGVKLVTEALISVDEILR